MMMMEASSVGWGDWGVGQWWNIVRGGVANGIE